MEEQIGYYRYREIQQNRLLDAAQRLFREHGIAAVNVDAIAKAAGMTRKTFYQYFTNKEAIANAVFLRFQTQRRAQFEKEVPFAEGTGYERLCAIVEDLFSVPKKQPEYARFIAEFDSLYQPDTDHAVMDEVYQSSVKTVRRALIKGMEDGTIDPMINPDTVATVILNMGAAVNTRYSLLPDETGEIYGRPAEELIAETCRIFLRGLRP